MNRSSLALLLPLLLLSFGTGACNNQDTAVPIADEPESEPVYFAPLIRGTDSALSDTTEAIVRSGAEWRDLVANLAPFEEPRAVDFSQAMLVVVALPVDTGGYMLDVETVELLSDSLVVSYVVYEPGGDCLNVEAAVTPYHVVEVRRMDAPVAFHKRREYVFCETRR